MMSSCPVFIRPLAKISTRIRYGDVSPAVSTLTAAIFFFAWRVLGAAGVYGTGGRGTVSGERSYSSAQTRCT
jgi:hypothetical protein